MTQDSQPSARLVASFEGKVVPFIGVLKASAAHRGRGRDDLNALLITVPAGLQGFFEELGDGLVAGRSSEEIRKTLAGKYESMPTD